MKTEQHLASALQAYRNGDETLEQFLVVLIEINRLHTDERASASSLLAILEKENDTAPLPPEVFDAVSCWIKLNADVAAAQSEQTHSVTQDLQPHPESQNDNRHKDDSPTDIELMDSQEGSPTDIELTDSQDDSPTDIELTNSQEGSLAVAPPLKHTVNNDRAHDELNVLNNRYVLVKLIGSGDISTVYKAIDLRKQEADAPEPYVAIKILKRAFHAHQDWLTVFHEEIQKCQWLTHPNIAKVYGLDRDASMVYIIMEYLPGESLAHTITSDNFRLNLNQQGQLLPLINKMGNALAFAHQRSIVHNDFKPAKVILTKDGEVKVFDFGIARALRDREVEDPTSESPLMETQVYASPEVLEHGVPDPCDDIYAFACTTYELLTGMHPFDRKTAIEARNAGMKVKFRKGLERRQWKALRHALAFDRSKRATDITQFLLKFNGHKLRVKPLLRFAAAVTAIVIALAIALNYHFSKLKQVKVAQLERGKYENLTPTSKLPDPFAQPSNLPENPKIGNALSSEEVDEVIAAIPPTTTDEVSTTIFTDETPEIALPVIEGPLDNTQTSQDLKAGDPSAEQPPKQTEQAETPSGPESIPLEKPQNNETDISDTDTTPLSEESTQNEESQIPLAVAPDQDSVVTNEKAQITALLSRGQRQIALKQLTNPAGANALEAFREILALEPGNELALKGIQDIKTQYKMWGQEAREQGNLTQAQGYLQKAIAIDPEDGTLKEVLVELQQAQRSDQAARATEQKVNALLQKAQQQIADQRLTQPQGNNAWESLKEIFQIAPENNQAHESLNTITGQLESMALAKQQTGDLHESLVLAEEGLLVRPDHSGLQTLKNELSHQIDLKLEADLAAEEAKINEKFATEEAELAAEQTNVDKAEMKPAKPQQTQRQPAIEEKKPRRFRPSGTF